MGEVSGGPLLTGWAGRMGEGPPPQPRPQGPLLWHSKCPTPLLHFSLCPHPPICTLICLRNSSVPSCFGFNKYFDGVWAGFWDSVLGTNLGVGEVNIAGKIPVLYFPSSCPYLISFQLSLTAPRKVGFITMFVLA